MKPPRSKFLQYIWFKAGGAEKYAGYKLHYSREGDCRVQHQIFL